MFINLVAYSIVPTSSWHVNEADDDDDNNANVKEVASETSGGEELEGRIPPGAMAKW